MFYRQYFHLLFFLFFAAMQIFTGCAEQIQKPTRICLGKQTASEALSFLRSRSKNAVPLKANGQCRLEYIAEGKPRKENFPVQIWLNPPSEISMQGDVAFDPRGVVLGSNDNEFWLAIRLKEINSCWLGKRAEISYIDGLMIDPRIVLEALGIVAVDGDKIDAENWSLSKEGVFDVLLRHGNKTGIIKKIYINNCDYSASKIEYFDVNERPVLVVELDKYEQVVEGFFVPRVIKITSQGENVEDLACVTVSLTSIKSTSFNQEQRNLLFNRPEPKRFKHIFVNIDGNWIEQRQD